MPTTRIPSLSAVAAKQADEQQAKKARGVLATLAGLLGISGDSAPAAVPAGKISKKTVTTRRVEMEESDDEGEEAEEEEEPPPSSKPGEDEDAEAEGESEAEESEAEESEAEESAEDAEAARALSAAVYAALRSPAVQRAFLAALPEGLREAGAAYSPAKILGLVKRATAKPSALEAFDALANFTATSKGASERVMAKQAKLEARIARVEGTTRKDRVNVIVMEAKRNGIAGATTKDGRDILREYGMANGTTKLRAWIAAQPKLSTDPKIPATDSEGAVLGAPSGDQQARMMEQAMAGLSEKEREEFKAIATEKTKALNGAANREA